MISLSQPWIHKALHRIFDICAIIFLINISFYADGQALECDGLNIKRSDFPCDFVFGVATSALQEDVKHLKDIGTGHYRFSISWSRILPRMISRTTVNFCSKHMETVKNWITINGPFVLVLVYDMVVKGAP
ncbi:Glycoside hydrolase [Parasponia andersonii]|uniref:Glycoside hydrolase n=1 Tax=Parasponia andersonii TaxID=3476 RepID=A0A2P5DVM8_PARAD|nr:Glycoside hydrolase [Parasponia andersonii]